MSSALGGLMGGKQKSTSTSSTTVDVPEWALGPLQQALTMATNAANIPYEAYSDPRFSGFSQDELNSFSGIRGIQGQWNPAFSQANDILGTVAQSGLEGFSQDYLNQYMNPYIQNVMDVQKQRSLETYDQQMRDYRGRAGEAGAFGGSRFGLGEAQMQKNFQQQLADQETVGLAAAYESGLAGAERGMARAGQAGLSMADLAAAGQGLAMGDYSALNAQGAQQRALEQAGLDFDYEQWLTEKQYPYNQASFLAGIASPIAAQVSGQTGTTTTQQSGGNKLGSILGAASMGASLFSGGGLGSAIGSLGGFLGINTPWNTNLSGGNNIIWDSLRRAKGGPIPFNFGNYAEGGVVEGEEGGLANAIIRGKYSPIKYGNQLAEWAIENPLEAAGTTLMFAPGVGWLGSGALKLGSAAMKTGKAAQAAKGLAGLVARNKGAVSTLAGMGLLGIDKLTDSPIEAPELEFDPKDEKDIYKLQQHMASIASEGKVGSKSDLSPERSKELLTKYPQLNPAYVEADPTGEALSEAMGIVPDQGLEAASVANTNEATGFVSQEQAKQLEKQNQDIITPLEEPQKREGFNKGLFQFGADLMMASQETDFFGSLGLAGANAMKRMEEQESAEKQAARQRFEDSIELYKLEQKDRQIANNERWQQIQAAQNINPYKQQLDQLKVMQAMQKLSQDPMAKNRLDAWKAMQRNPMMLDTTEGKQLNSEVMRMLMQGGGMSSGPSAPPDDLFDD